MYEITYDLTLINKDVLAERVEGNLWKIYYRSGTTDCAYEEEFEFISRGK